VLTGLTMNRLPPDLDRRARLGLLTFDDLMESAGSGESAS
jgi:hypothetical protein